MNKRNNKILTNGVLIGKDLFKISVRQPTVSNIDDGLVHLKFLYLQYISIFLI